MQRPNIIHYSPGQISNIEEIWFDGKMIGKCDKMRIESGKCLRIIFYNIPPKAIHKYIIGHNSIVEVIVFIKNYKTITITGAVTEISFNPTSLETQVIMKGDID